MLLLSPLLPKKPLINQEICLHCNFLVHSNFSTPENILRLKEEGKKTVNGFLSSAKTKTFAVLSSRSKAMSALTTKSKISDYI